MSASYLYAQGPVTDAEFEELAARFIDEMPEHSPVSATQLGDHRFDAQLDRVDSATRAARKELFERYLSEVTALDRDELSRANQVDAELLRHELEAGLWSLAELQSWAWNPLDYTDLAGSAIYGLLAREFAPLEERLLRVEARLRQLPRFFEQMRENLDPLRVPRIHAETAIRQHAGLMSLVDAMVVPEMANLKPGVRARLAIAIGIAREAARVQGMWLETELLPRAEGEFRLGEDLYEQKLHYTLNSPLTRREVRVRAEREFGLVRDAMYEVASMVYGAKYPYADLPERPADDLMQAIIRAALEEAYLQIPDRDE
ncbi:MAG TPA: DUF885 family protein, partial [Gammaproteobacteria bacterium]|nr:DUF885 family protein [Gammaproteobacteria bacterium]